MGLGRLVWSRTSPWLSSYSSGYLERQDRRPLLKHCDSLKLIFVTQNTGMLGNSSIYFGLTSGMIFAQLITL